MATKASTLVGRSFCLESFCTPEHHRWSPSLERHLAKRLHPHLRGRFGLSQKSRRDHDVMAAMVTANYERTAFSRYESHIP